ncbi:hypothetical protein [Winogradskya humida]|uniref:DUF1877 family protein n=1 Tax=Winogradskya humida TaxID=113566 RepID=A0ABQ3ZNN6_9ACTN|nr:hypothetical protein [Actinoplanes humidus]GIE20199.1 hypothetical protein Ahu01nite_033010 [Actinoplanes humidus]
MPITDYFTAPDDRAALAGLAEGPIAAGLPTLESKNLDPVVNLGTLESLLTGLSYDEVIEGPRQGDLVSDPEASPESHVVAVTDRLRDALVAADDARLVETAAHWSRTEELEGTDPDGLAGFLRDLAALARDGGESHLYCWWAL